eukprot:TRINITY_DN535_c0_g1_i8.p1 TRINITY_DN535_c0_g1~~TRINITY_DN535_c0_g1_i8.p1  ORF type:complete len:153 (+),score=2.54 TRINITY_DN535_c0_g1_i8:149-607(+)
MDAINDLISNFIAKQILTDATSSLHSRIQMGININITIQWKKLSLRKNRHSIAQALPPMLLKLVTTKALLPVELISPSEEDIEKVIDFINLGAEIEELAISNFKSKATCLGDMEPPMVHHLESIKADDLGIKLNFCMFSAKCIITVHRLQQY